MRNVAIGIALFAIIACVTNVAFAEDRHEHEDMVVGITGGGQLTIEFEHFGEAHGLPPVNGPLLYGWSGDDPGFGHLEAAEPGEDFYTLQAGVDVLVEIVAIDAGLHVYAPGYTSELGVGDSASLGAETLHSHLGWFINANDPGVDPDLYDYSVTFRLNDGGTTGYATSGDYTLTFVPEPSSVLLMVLGGGLALLRRR